MRLFIYIIGGILLLSLGPLSCEKLTGSRQAASPAEPYDLIWEIVAVADGGAYVAGLDSVYYLDEHGNAWEIAGLPADVGFVQLTPLAKKGAYLSTFDGLWFLDQATAKAVPRPRPSALR